MRCLAFCEVARADVRTVTLADERVRLAELWVAVALRLAAFCRRVAAALWPAA
jgi:hypothetical protein